MNVLLGERNGYVLGVEPLFDGACHIPIDGPVIFGLDPGPTDEIDRRIGQLVQSDHGLGFVENQFMF